MKTHRRQLITDDMVYRALNRTRGPQVAPVDRLGMRILIRDRINRMDGSQRERAQEIVEASKPHHSPAGIPLGNPWGRRTK